MSRSWDTILKFIPFFFSSAACIVNRRSVSYAMQMFISLPAKCWIDVLEKIECERA